MLEYEEKKLLEPPCPCPNPECTSSDGFHIWQKGSVIDGYCFVCGRASSDPYKDLNRSQSNTFDKWSNNDARNSPARIDGPNLKLTLEEGLAHPIRGLPSRHITYATAEYFGVRIGVSPRDGETPVYTLFPRYRKGEQVGWKTKIPNGTPPYVNSGGPDADLFGSHLVKPQGKKLYITEGEIDALSLYQVLKENSGIQGWEPPVVSLPDGAQTGLKALVRSSDLLEGYDQIVLVLDNDEAGKEAREKICKAFAGKVSYVVLPLKDANEMLMAGKGNDLKWLSLTHAKKYQPDGIVNARDLKDRWKNKEDKLSYPYMDTLPILNERTYGARPGSIITITSGSGCGKTQFMRELMYHYYITTEENIGGMYLEEDVTETLDGLIALDLNKRISLPDVESTEEELDESYDKLYGSGRITLYDYFGGMDDASLLSKLRYLALDGCKFIFLDHLSIIVSEYAAQGGERERIDTLMTKLAKFVKEFNVVLFLVVHLRKSDSKGKSFEEGAVPTMDDLRGSAALKQLSWDVLALSRNQQHASSYCANTTEISVLKCRFTGRTGVADYVTFNDATGRQYTVDMPLNYR